MVDGRVQTVRRNGTWTNEIEGSGIVSTHRTRDEAIEAGRDLALARATEHVVFNSDGTIGARASYGRS